MRSLLALLFFIFYITATYAQAIKHSRIKVFTGKEGIMQMAGSGLPVDHGECKKDTWFVSDFSEKEIAIIDSLGLAYEVIIADVQQYYIKQNANTDKTGGPVSILCYPSHSYVTPSGFTYGSMGGFYTYNELLSHLDTMQARFPGLITLKAPAGNTLTYEGRPVYWVRISDNAIIDEPEPEMLYTALHHAREPASASQLIYYMYYLLENYSTNAEVQYLLNNTELYFIPCVNPDGYVYNETTFPTGGGLWRKNRFMNGDGTFGIDLNRNYGFNWGYDNNGSSPQTNMDTYRGTGPFSEPETQILRDFINSQQFRITLNHHTFGNYLLYPWGYEASTFTADSALFTDYARLLTSGNHYRTGTSDQMLGYVTNGSADDWMYGEQGTKPKIISMTPETGDASFGFWPPQSGIIPICELNLRQNLYAPHLLLEYAEVKDRETGYISQLNGYFNFSLKQLGLDATGSYTVSILPLSSYITNTGASKIIPAPALLQEVQDSISYTLSSSTPFGQVIQYVIQVDNGLYVRSDTITKRYGTSTIALASNGSNVTGWQTSGWGTDNTYYWSPNTSITDSPYTDYTANSYSDITSAPVNLTTSISALLRFRARWEIEKRFDYAQVLITMDGGANWIPLCGKYTTPGSGYQDFNNPVYDGGQPAWVDEEISLDDYTGSTVQVRFRLISDMGNEYDGFYFDDLMIQKLDTNFSSIDEDNSTLHGSISQNTPNPTDDYTFISYSFEGNTQLQIYNTLGKMVYSQEAIGGKNNLKINTSTLAPGIYYYRFVQGDKNSASLKITVIH